MGALLGGALEARFLWLALVVALAATRSAPALHELYAPYLDLIAEGTQGGSGGLVAKDSARTPAHAAALRHLEAVHAHAAAELAVQLEERADSKKFGGGRRALQRHGVAHLPNATAIEWALRTVLARSVSLPAGCPPSAPQSLPDLVNDIVSEGGSAALIPTLVPILDMLNHPPPAGQDVNAPGLPGNTQIFTGVEGGRGGRPCIVLVAAHAIDAGTALNTEYNRSTVAALTDPQQWALTQFRFGF
jgi:hypothetical protein